MSLSELTSNLCQHWIFVFVDKMDNEAKIEKLQDISEWSRWKFQVRIVLNASELFEVVSGDDPMPTRARRVSETDSQAGDRYAQELKDWKKKDNKAQRCIATTVGKEPLTHIMNYGTAKEMWDKLHSVYEQKSETSVHLLQQKFYLYVMDLNDNIATHISKLEDFSSQLKDLGEEIPTSMLITKILMTLPPNYSHFHSAWESTSVNDRTLKNLTSRLMVEEARMSANDGESNSNAFSARSYSKPRSFHTKPSGIRPGKCYQCNRSGHWRRDCPTLKKTGETSSNHAYGEACEAEALVCEAFISEQDFYSAKRESDKWFMDSGASDHMSSKREWFINFIDLKVPIPIRIGNGKHIFAVGIGEIVILSSNGKKWVKKRLLNVLFVPDIKLQLFSLGMALDKGLKFTASSHSCVFKKDDVTVAVGERSSRLFEMKFKVLPPQCEISQANTATREKDVLSLWHERLGHQHISRVKEILTKMNIRFPNRSNFFCESCLFGKQHRLPFKPTGTSAVLPGNIIHTDTCGPMQERSIGGSRYFVLFKDDYSHYRTIYFMKAKSEVKRILEKYLKVVKMDTNFDVKVMRSDNGTEFVNVDVTKILEERGIRHQRTVPYSPEQNGSAEREMRTIVEAARTMIHAKNLPIKLWAEATNAAVYILNRTGTSSVKGVSPFELWFGKQPQIDHLKVFGSKVFTHIPQEKRRKWDRKAEEGVFVGYCENTKGFRIWQPEVNKIIVSRDIIFKEDEDVTTDVNGSTDIQPCVVFDLNGSANPDPDSTSLDGSAIPVSDLNSSMSSDGSAITTINISSDFDYSPETTLSTTNDVTDNGDESESFDGQDNNVLSSRLRNRDEMPVPNYNPSYSFLDSLLNVAESFISEIEEPESYTAAIKSLDSEKWNKAIQEEMESLLENNTWSLVNLPKNRRAIGNRWVFKIKCAANGDIDRYKARLVVKGYTQKYGIDYQETFCPVVKFSSIRMILAVSAIEKLKLRQFDVKTAFLYGELDEEIYMQQPEGFNDNSGKVCRLNRSLYGLKQASRCWNKKFTDFLKSFGLVASKADPCVFIARMDGKIIILAIFTDDGLIAVSDESDATKLDFALRQKFHVKFNDLNYFLGLQIGTNDDGSICMHQEGYARKVLNKFKMDDCNPVHVPFDPNTMVKFSDHTQEVMPARNVPYRELIGSLMYLAIATRPDISFALSYLSQHLENPSVAHWNALKRMLKYIKGTSNYGIKFNANSNVQLNVYSDADFAGDVETRVSRTGFVHMIGTAPISWCSQKQRTVSLSTAESEYIASSESVRELVWLQLLLSEIDPINTSIPTLFVDNQSALKQIKNPENHKRSKHVDVKYHFIREKFTKGFFKLQFIPSKDQTADIFTKPLAKDIFARFRSKMGIVEL